MNKYEKILIVGAGGGREHAIGWKIKESGRAGKLFFARGNAGTAEIGTNLDIKDTDIPKLLDFARNEHVDLVLVVADDPLAAGAVDEFRSAGFRVWGPTKEASKLEWSKAFAKDFMERYHIPTARHQVFNNFDKSVAYIRKGDFPVVVKASGLAMGKGVVIAQTKGEAEKALHDILVNKIFGDSGNEVVIEEFLEGIEISVHAFSDGISWKMFPASQDHKRIFDGNAGPNTGGMGVIAPLPFITKDIMDRIEKEIIAPAIRGMEKDGNPFMGCLYPGVMITKDGPKVFEFNARFGDPETETYMRLLSTDLLDIIDASIDQELFKQEIKWKNDLSACSIALASGGYPGNYEKGKVITGAENLDTEDIVIFHSGTAMKDSELVTNGGRVLWVTAIGNSLQEALNKAYGIIQKIHFEGMQYRKDIGKGAIELSK